MTAITDTHLENLGTYLKERLNEAGAALSTPLTVVEDVTYLTDFNALDKFPLLQVYRTGGRGFIGETQNYEINYSLTNYADPYEVPRILAWVIESHNANNIRELLVNYFSTTDRCGTLDVENISWNYGYKILGQNKVPSLRDKVPSLRVSFDLLP